jgi:hypothetical protein
MPVLPTEVLYYLSNPSASTGFSGSGTPGNSLGTFMSTTQINQQTLLDDLFLDISGSQNAAGQVDYQCLFVMNNTVSTLPMTNIYMWFPTALWTFGGAGMALGVDPTGQVPYNSPAHQALTIGSSTTAPLGVSFNAGPDLTFSAGVFVGSLKAQYCIAVWLQRTAVNSAVLTPQTLVLTSTYQSNA